MPKTAKVAPEPLEKADHRSGGGTTIALVSNDGRRFEVRKSAAAVSEFVVDSLNLEDEEEEPENGYEEVGLPRVGGECLDRVVRFMEHHDREAMPEINMPLGGDTFEAVSFVHKCSIVAWDHCERILCSMGFDAFYQSAFPSKQWRCHSAHL